MRVKMIKTAAGPDGVRQSGHEYDLSNEESAQLLEAGAAIPIGRIAAEERELAIAPAPEVRAEEPDAGEPEETFAAPVPTPKRKKKRKR